MYTPATSPTLYGNAPASSRVVVQPESSTTGFTPVLSTLNTPKHLRSSVSVDDRSQLSTAFNAQFVQNPLIHDVAHHGRESQVARPFGATPTRVRTRVTNGPTAPYVHCRECRTVALGAPRPKPMCETGCCDMYAVACCGHHLYCAHHALTQGLSVWNDELEVPEFDQCDVNLTYCYKPHNGAAFHRVNECSYCHNHPWIDITRDGDVERNPGPVVPLCEVGCCDARAVACCGHATYCVHHALTQGLSVWNDEFEMPEFEQREARLTFCDQQHACTPFHRVGRCGHCRFPVWRDLTNDGDVEANPGPPKPVWRIKAKPENAAAPEPTQSVWSWVPEPAVPDSTRLLHVPEAALCLLDETIIEPCWHCDRAVATTSAEWRVIGGHVMHWSCHLRTITDDDLHVVTMPPAAPDSNATQLVDPLLPLAFASDTTPRLDPLSATYEVTLEEVSESSSAIGAHSTPSNLCHRCGCAVDETGGNMATFEGHLVHPGCRDAYMLALTPLPKPKPAAAKPRAPSANTPIAQTARSETIMIEQQYALPPKPAATHSQRAEKRRDRARDVEGQPPTKFRVCTASYSLEHAKRALECADKHPLTLHLFNGDPTGRDAQAAADYLASKGFTMDYDRDYEYLFQFASFGFRITLEDNRFEWERRHRDGPRTLYTLSTNRDGRKVWSLRCEDIVGVERIVYGTAYECLAWLFDTYRAHAAELVTIPTVDTTPTLRPPRPTATPKPAPCDLAAFPVSYATAAQATRATTPTPDAGIKPCLRCNRAVTGADSATFHGQLVHRDCLTVLNGLFAPLDTQSSTTAQPSAQPAAPITNGSAAASAQSSIPHTSSATQPPTGTGSQSGPDPFGNATHNAYQNATLLSDLSSAPDVDEVVEEDDEDVEESWLDGEVPCHAKVYRKLGRQPRPTPALPLHEILREFEDDITSGAMYLEFVQALPHNDEPAKTHTFGWSNRSQLRGTRVLRFSQDSRTPGFYTHVECELRGPLHMPMYGAIPDTNLQLRLVAPSNTIFSRQRVHRVEFVTQHRQQCRHVFRHAKNEWMPRHIKRYSTWDHFICKLAFRDEAYPCNCDVTGVAIPSMQYNRHRVFRIGKNSEFVPRIDRHTREILYAGIPSCTTFETAVAHVTRINNSRASTLRSLEMTTDPVQLLEKQRLAARYPTLDENQIRDVALSLLTRNRALTVERETRALPYLIHGCSAVDQSDVWIEIPGIFDADDSPHMVAAREDAHTRQCDHSGSRKGKWCTACWNENIRHCGHFTMRTIIPGAANRARTRNTQCGICDESNYRASAIKRYMFDTHCGMRLCKSGGGPPAFRAAWNGTEFHTQYGTVLECAPFALPCEMHLKTGPLDPSVKCRTVYPNVLTQVPPLQRGPSLYGIALTAAIPRVTAKHPACLVSSFHARQGKPFLPVDAGVLALWQDFIPRFVHRHFADVEPVVPWSFDRWVLRFPPTRQRALRQARAKLAAEGLEQRELNREIFQKRELLTPKTPEAARDYVADDIAGRIITSLPKLKGLTVLGPFICAIQEDLKYRWRPDSKTMSFACGLNATSLGSIFSKAHEMPFAIDADQSKCDASLNRHLLDLERAVYKQYGLKAHHTAWRVYRAQWKTKATCYQSSEQVAQMRWKYKRNSGDPNTSLGNSLINAALWEFSIEMCGYSLDDFSINIGGDDSLICSNIDPAIWLAPVIGVQRALGMVIEANTPESKWALSFMGARGYPAVLHGRETIVTAPCFERFFCKVGWSLDERTEPDVWLRGVALGWLPFVSHVPPMADFLGAVLRLTRNVQAKPILPDSQAYRQTMKPCGARPSQRAHEALADIAYDRGHTYSFQSYLDFAISMAAIRKLPAMVDHEYLHSLI